jgi:AhpD family alkylhydroperoxidase
MRNSRVFVAVMAAGILVVTLGIIVTTFLPARSDAAGGPATVSGEPDLVAVERLLDDARVRARAGAAARVPLAEAPGVSDAAAWLGGPSAPNYLRAFGTAPHLAEPLGRLVHAVLYRGALPTETKAAMGLRVAQLTGSPYLAAHAARVLRGSERGRVLAGALGSRALAEVSEAERLAVKYAEFLTRSVHGVTPEQFARTRAAFNDAEIVELTIAVAFFNYFARFVEGLALPVEPWTLEGAPPLAPSPGGATGARVALISDEEIAATGAAAAQARDPEVQKRGLGLGMAHSQRAMLRAPELGVAWRGMGSAFRERQSLPRDLLLQVSLAVSMVNGCRYCTIHQVLGLRRQGVDPGKLLALRKDDEALTPRELVAVEFARALTRGPAEVTDAGYERLRAEFGEAGALEVLLQTCTFAFMNRFTDGLALPSEDEAVRVYQEVYGTE